MAKRRTILERKFSIFRDRFLNGPDSPESFVDGKILVACLEFLAVQRANEGGKTRWEPTAFW
jgi:hypothetical protein